MLVDCVSASRPSDSGRLLFPVAQFADCQSGRPGISGGSALASTGLGGARPEVSTEAALTGSCERG